MAPARAAAILATLGLVGLALRPTGHDDDALLGRRDPVEVVTVEKAPLEKVPAHSSSLMLIREAARGYLAQLESPDTEEEATHNMFMILFGGCLVLIVGGLGVSLATGWWSSGAEEEEEEGREIQPAQPRVGFDQGFATMSQVRRDKKLKEANKGSELAQQNPPFPAGRTPQDLFFVVLFLATVFAVLLYSMINTHNANRVLRADHEIALWSIIMVLMAGFALSVLTAILYVWLLATIPAFMVWLTLIFGPIVIIAVGGATMLAQPVVGMFMMGLGVLILFFFFFMLGEYVEFTIEVAEVVAGVIQSNPCMIFASMVGSTFGGLLWPLAMLVCGLAVQTHAPNTFMAIRLILLFVLIWGLQVGTYHSHTVTCGVFGRWYYNKETRAPVSKSLVAASTTSLGSISFAAFVVGLVRTAEAMLDSARNDAASNGNFVACICIGIMQCIISCIGDVLDYFSEWALVQVAVRGTTFVQSARITFTFATWGNVRLIISDLLLNSVASFAAFLCAVAGGLGGSGSLLLLGHGHLAGFGAVFGALAGMAVGAAAGGMVSSGGKTVLVCWAEAPEVLEELRPEIAASFETRAGKLQ